MKTCCHDACAITPTPMVVLPSDFPLGEMPFKALSQFCLAALALDSIIYVIRMEI